MMRSPVFSPAVVCLTVNDGRDKLPPGNACKFHLNSMGCWSRGVSRDKVAAATNSMALKATIYKARVQFSDLDRNVYADHAVTIARHPSETDERLLVRLLAFALNAPAGRDELALEFAQDMWEPDEPSLWQKDPTGRVAHWIEVGQPDEKRLLRTSARVDRLTVFSFGSRTPIWWRDLAPRLTRLRNLTVWQIPSEQSQALAALAQRTMQLQVTVQDGSIWVDDGTSSVEVAPQRLWGPAEP